MKTIFKLNKAVQSYENARNKNCVLFGDLWHTMPPHKGHDLYQVEDPLGKP